MRRTLGCVILSTLPDAGVEEAIESLADIWRYHAYVPAAPALPAEETYRVGRTVVASESERPPLSLSED